MAGAVDQPKSIKRKSKKENGKASVELVLAPSSGKKSKRVRCTKDQMAVNALAKVVELSLKVGRTPSQELLKFVGVGPEEEEKVVMGMDDPNDLDYCERESFPEEEPLYEEGPLELGVETPHIFSSVTFNTPPPPLEEEKRRRRGGGHGWGRWRGIIGRRS